MTAKRYYAHKHFINEDKVHDKICHRFMNITETVEHMNMYYQKYTALKKENEQLKKQLKELQEFKDNYDKNMELIHNSEYVQDFLNGNL